LEEVGGRERFGGSTVVTADFDLLPVKCLFGFLAKSTDLDR